MKRLLPHVSIRIVLLLSVTFSALSVVGQRAVTGCRSGIQTDQIKQDLDRAASTAVEAIKQGHSEHLIPLLSANGVVLGVDGPLVRLAQIRKEMSAKTGLYCVIYDTSCLIKEVNASRKKAGARLDDKEIVSFRDHLLKSGLVVKTALNDNSSSCGATTSDESPSFEIDWAWTPKGWKIVAIPYL